MRCPVVRSVITLCVAFVLNFPVMAGAFSLENPQQTGMAINVGSSYDPKPSFSFFQLSLMALYDYEQIMSHSAPEPLRFKLEASLGLTDDSEKRMIASANFLALYYLRILEINHFRPYVEAGAGVAYTDFQVSGQGLRVNFNPQAGIGTEWQKGIQHWYGALRVSHISNGNLHRNNRGINAVTLQLGVYF